MAKPSEPSAPRRRISRQPQPDVAPPSSPLPSDTPPPAPTPVPDATEQEASMVGSWECLASPAECVAAAPDFKTPGKHFEGPTQREVRRMGPEARITCPTCGGDKVIYRGDKTPAAVAA